MGKLPFHVLTPLASTASRFVNGFSAGNSRRQQQAAKTGQES